MKYLMILCLLIAFGNRSNACGRQDSIEVFSTYELKDNSKLLDELEYRRNADSLEAIKDLEQQQALNDFKILYDGSKEIIKLKDEHIKTLEKQVEVVRPAWYDNFATGSAVTAAILAIIYLIIPK